MNIRRELNWMDRNQLVSILEDYGFQCYDNESDDDLRNAIFENIEDGTISIFDFEGLCHG